VRDERLLFKQEVLNKAIENYKEIGARAFSVIYGFEILQDA